MQEYHMGWVSNWIQGIIIAVVISTIVEMILPEGNSKKYIKVVIGVYILFSIVSPVISKVTGNSFQVSDILNIDEYIEASSSNTYQNLEQSQEQQIKEIYISSLKSDMKEKIEGKGYIVEDIILEVQDDEEYTINKITLDLKKQKNNSNREDKLNNSINENNVKSAEASTVNSIQEINKINITIGNKENTDETKSEEKTKKETLSNKEQNELKEYLSGVYEIEKQNININ
jgi:stage III sporulation protein AF